MRRKISEFRCCLNEDDLNIEGVNYFCKKDSNRIVGKIAQSLALTSPWISFIDPYFQLRMDAKQLVDAWKILKKYYKKTK